MSEPKAQKFKYSSVQKGLFVVNGERVDVPQITLLDDNGNETGHLCGPEAQFVADYAEDLKKEIEPLRKRWPGKKISIQVDG